MAVSSSNPPSSTQRHESHTQRPSFSLIAAITVTGILANTLPNAGIPNILEDFHRPDSAAGILVAAASVPGILVAPIVGIFADRYGRRAVLVPCLVAFGLFGLMGAFAPSFTWLIAARFGQGIGSAGLINLTNILIGDHWQGLERTKMFGYNSAILTVSLAVLPFLGGFLTDLGGWRLAFAPYPLAIITALVVMKRLGPGPTDGTSTIREQLAAAATVVRYKAVLIPIVLALATFVMIFGLFLTALPVHLEEDFGMSATQRGLIIALPAIGGTIGSLTVGRLRGAFSAYRIAAAAFALFAVAYPLIGLTNALWMLTVAAVVYGLGEAWLLTTLTDLVAEATPEATRGAVMSVHMGAARTGQSIGPLLAGAGMAVMSTGMVFVVAGIMAATLCLAVIAGGLDS